MDFLYPATNIVKSWIKGQPLGHTVLTSFDPPPIAIGICSKPLDSSGCNWELVLTWNSQTLNRCIGVHNMHKVSRLPTLEPMLTMMVMSTTTTTIIIITSIIDYARIYEFMTHWSSTGVSLLFSVSWQVLYVADAVWHCVHYENKTWTSDKNLQQYSDVFWSVFCIVIVTPT